jgi:hypothetical protein
MAMKAERDHLAQLLKFHHQARVEVQS